MARRKTVIDHFASLSETSCVCPLCSSQGTEPYWQDRKRPYLQCSVCQLVFVPAAFHLSEAQEKSEYDLHQNRFEDEGYRTFLSRAMNPVLERVTSPAQGLDFGCGPGPVLAEMLSEAGYQMSVYDPFYAAHPDSLNKHYDFITCTEVIEHVAEPAQVFAKLSAMLVNQGVLVMMTKRVTSKEAFSNWHYKNDSTHICFYSESTFRWVAEQYQLNYEFVGQDVVVFSK